MHAPDDCSFQERFLRLAEVESRIGLRSSKIYQMIRDGEFPAPVRICGRVSRWPLSDVSRWMSEQVRSSSSSNSAAVSAANYRQHSGEVHDVPR
jgi:prophage regulatory protein